MPSSWEMQVGVTQRYVGRLVRRQDIHGAVATWLKSHEFSLGHISLDAEQQVLTFQVRFLDDALAGPLLQVLAGGSGAGQFGAHNEYAVEPGISGIELVSRATWAELAEAAPADEWEIEFLTPTMFSSGKFKDVLPRPMPILGSLRERWGSAPKEFQFHGLPDLAKLHLITTDLELSTRQDFGYSKIIGVQGFVRQRCVGASDEVAQAIGCWLSLLPYVGIGYNQSHGFGVARATWRRRHSEGAESTHADDPDADASVVPTVVDE